MNFEVPVIDRFQLLSSCECNLNEIPACFFLETSVGIWTSRLLNPFNEIQNHLSQTSKFGGSRSSRTSTCLGSSSCHGLFSGNSRGDRANSGALEVLECLGWLPCEVAGWFVWFGFLCFGLVLLLVFVLFAFVCLFGWLVIVAILYHIVPNSPNRLGS